MLCPNCRKEIDDDSKFCRYCGSTINTSSTNESSISNTNNEANTNSSSTPTKKKISKGVIFGLVAVAVVGIALFTLLSGNNNTPSENTQTVSSDKNSTNQIKENEASTSTDTASEKEPPVKAKENMVLLDQNGIYVEYRGIAEHSDESWILNLYAENNTDAEIYLTTDDCLINNASMGLSNNGTGIPAKSKYLAEPNFNFIIDLEDLAIYDITTLETLSFNLTIEDGTSYETIIEVPINLAINKKLP